ncbi:hypothetical protein B0A52_03600 [Exophiala mesophila]|uniref:VOC domain-containing protein n=1 Tax=Exophiala mesophila TaxID=212818 RepID=A0A438N9G5_EXOME|nr:hypothetical protein B0A52_03600 [Exophiala mesophila]
MASNTIDAKTSSNVNVQMSRRPSPIALAHIVLRTTPENYKKMVWFYQELLNGEIVLEEEAFVFLRYDYEHHRVGILKTPDTKPKEGDHAGLEHISFTFATLTDMARIYQHLKDLGIEPYWAVNHGMTSSMYYRDPEKNKVELQIENFDTPEEADAFVRGPLFQSNPIGTDIDPPSWADRILSKMKPTGEEGLSESEMREIKLRREIGPRNTMPDYVLAP